MNGDTRIHTITQWDFKQACQSRLVWGASVLLFLLIVPSFWSMVANLHYVEQSAPQAIRAVGTIPSYLSTFLEITALALGYAAVATERESGTIHLVLGLPGTRRDVLVGKILSRCLVLATVLGLLLTVLGAIIVVHQGWLPAVAFTVISGWVLLCGLCWLVFAVGLSAAFSSRCRALAAIAGTYIFFASNAPIWKAVLEPGLRGVLPGSSHRYVDALNPTMTLFIVDDWLLASVSSSSSNVLLGLVAVSLLSLLTVAVGGFFIGYRRFEAADLG